MDDSVFGKRATFNDSGSSVDHLLFDLAANIFFGYGIQKGQD